MNQPPDVAQFVREFAAGLRQMAQETGTGCDLPGCDALTLGVRCDNCLRRVCNTHAYWQLGKKMTAWCPYCVVAANTQLFDHSDDAAAPTQEQDDDVVDAEFEET